jgi:hypothetical protein
MTLMAIGRCFGKSKNWNQCEPTITEILSDSITVAVMKADGVDPIPLEAQLRSFAQNAAVPHRTNSAFALKRSG